MYLSGVSFYVLSDDFLVHQSHIYDEMARKLEVRRFALIAYLISRQRAATIQPENLRGLPRRDLPQVRKKNGRLFKRSEIPFYRYIKAFFDSGTLESPRAANARQECKKIRSISRFVTQVRMVG